MSDPVIVRQMNPAVKGEVEFILSTWLRELHDADPSGLPSDLWFEAHRQHVRNVLTDRESVVLIAADAVEPSLILGYVVTFPGSHLEWVHVKKKYRGEGIAKRLLTEAQCPPGTPARFQTPWSRSRLRNPCRSRNLRSRRSLTASESRPST